MRLTFQHDADLITLNAEPAGEGWRVRLPDGTEHLVTLQRLPDDVIEIMEREDPTATSTVIGGAARAWRIPFARTEQDLLFSYGGQAFAFTPATDRPAGGSHRRASGALTAPMVGVVADVLVQAGQTVEAYQPLVIIEAMKVMATVEAPFAGTVTAVHVQKSQRVEHG